MDFYFNSKNFALKTIAIILIFLSYQSNINAQRKPNVIFILADDVGYDILSVNGNKSYSTPHIDSMAHQGINFTHCEGSPLCSPSRFMLLTGKYNFRNYSNWGYMSDSEKTFGNVMQDAGYKTGFFGKLQLNFSYQTMAKWGFNKYTIFSIAEDSIPIRRYKNPTLIDNYGRIPDSLVQNQYCDDILTNRITNFIDSNRNNPFFVYYSMSEAHEPFSPTPADSAYANWDASKNKSNPAFFHSMIERMDYEVGMILNKLAATGLDKNTIVIFCGDNGTPVEIHYDTDSLTNVEGEKAHTKESGTHVPLIAYWPSKIKPGQKNDDLIDFTDFLPTFAQAANNHALSKYAPLDGVSFYSRMLGVEDTAKQQLFMHYNAYPGFDDLKRWVRDKNYKLYDSLNGAPLRFYNIVKDPKETNPLNDKKLTAQEKAIEKRFKYILDTMPTWPHAPVLSDPYAINIMPHSCTIGATIVNSGATNLIDRGSNIIQNKAYCVLGFGRAHDSTIALGSLSENREGLFSQSLYYFSIYAMNGNVSHSTGYARGKFYTLSEAPITQPSYFKACVDSSSILLNWDRAEFPSQGAVLRGYAVFYSTSNIQLIDNPNGVNPSKITKNGTLLYIDSNRLANKLDTFFHVSTLAKNTNYHFLLVPYTWNGTTDSTCNYLTAGALNTTVNFSSNLLTLNFAAENPVCFNDENGFITASASYGISPYKFSLNNKDYTSDSVFNNLSAGKYLLTVKDANGCLNSDSVVLKSPAKIKLNVSVTNTDCKSDGKIVASAKGGIPPYMFSFDNGNYDTTSHFINLSKGDYKISVRDSNKCISSSEAVVALTETCASDITISPNPSNSVFKITIGNNLISEHIKIKVYGVSDKLVYSAQGTQKQSYVFGSTFIKGIYFVEVGTETKVYKFKIIKE
jgi:arylsulfatase A